MHGDQLFVLNEMTGKTAAENRTTKVVGRIEARPRTLIVLIGGAVVGIVPTAIAIRLVGPVFGGLLWVAIVAAAYLLFNVRVRQGVRVYSYQALLRRSRATLNEFQFGGTTLTVPRRDWRIVRAGSKPARPPSPRELLDAEQRPADPVAAVFNP